MCTFSQQDLLGQCADAVQSLAEQLLNPQIPVDYIERCLEEIAAVLTEASDINPSPNEEKIFALLQSARDSLQPQSKSLTKDQLCFLIDCQFKVPDIARFFAVSERTVFRRMPKYGLSIQQTYSPISDEELSMVIVNFLAHSPMSGLRTIIGHLNSIGIP